MAMETLNISDGTSMQITRLPDVDDETWAEVRSYVEANPETAKALQSFAKNPDAMRGWLQTQAIAEHYNTKLANGDTPVQDKAAMKYYQDEELMLKISAKMGGLPSELNPVLQKIEDTPITLHEANTSAPWTLQPLQHDQIYSGMTCITTCVMLYDPSDIGANRIAVVKLLLDSRANPYSVDSSGNSGLHYAAGYGRRELLEYLLKVGANVNQPNAQGLTPLGAATQNRQEGTMGVLISHGAQ
eukprot:Skav210604  [mRNA]  locus=scaffold234:65601:66426:+ [translate_table: standard]